MLDNQILTRFVCFVKFLKISSDYAYVGKMLAKVLYLCAKK